jgi:hypothetical protein
LDRSGVEGPLADGLREAIDGATRAPERASPFAAVSRWAWRSYDRMLEWSWFHRAIWLVFVLQAVAELVAALAFAWAAVNDNAPPLRQQGALITSLVSLVFVLLGMWRLPRSRLDAYRWFERAVLISILFTRVILFWQDQLTALGGLIWDLALLTVLRFLIRQEEARVSLNV